MRGGLIELTIAIVLATTSSSTKAGKPITGCCEKGGKCIGNVHGGFEAAICEGNMIQGRYIKGKVCQRPNVAPCVKPGGPNPTDQDDSGEIEYSCTGLPLGNEGKLSCKLSDDNPSPDILTIPAVLGGGAVVSKDFEVTFTVKYVRSDDGTYEFALTSYNASAPSKEISNNDSGTNKLTLVPGAITGGRWNPETGAVAGIFALQTTNKLFNAEAPLVSFPSIDGTFDAETGKLVIQSKANVFWPTDSAARLGREPASQPPTPIIRKPQGCIRCAETAPGSGFLFLVVILVLVPLRAQRRRRT